MNVRVRGIYATALTAVLAREFDVVDASGPIRERFGAEFAVAPVDAAVETTGDRQGVGVRGDPDAVEAVAAEVRVDRDALAWDDPAPAGAVFHGSVTDALGSGAVVDLGEGGEGFLPYDNADGYVEAGDDLRVQVADPRPPWSDDRPVLETDLRVETPLVTLVRGDRATDDRHLGDLLPVDPPEGWHARWAPAGEDADLDALRTALERASGRAEQLMAAVASAGDEHGLVAAPTATRWVWFGRESRFALDDRRREVTATMPGHHRIKAGAEAASAAVDFVESLCEPAGEFPFDAVTRQFGPREGDRVAIGHGKPEGRLVTLGRGEVTDRDPDGGLTVRRELSGGGTYDALGVDRRAGDVAVTKFREGRWWYPTVYRGEGGERRGTYVNVCTPVEVFPRAVRYVDLHVDVVKGPDGAVERVDDDELDAAVDAGHVPEKLAERARAVADRVVEAL